MLKTTGINSGNGMNIDTVWRVISRSHGEVINGPLVGFSDFQREPRFGSKIDERVVDFQRRFVDSKASFYDYPGKAFCPSRN